MLSFLPVLQGIKLTADEALVVAGIIRARFPLLKSLCLANSGVESIRVCTCLGHAFVGQLNMHLAARAHESLSSLARLSQLQYVNIPLLMASILMGENAF